MSQNVSVGFLMHVELMGTHPLEKKLIPIMLIGVGVMAGNKEVVTNLSLVKFILFLKAAKRMAHEII